MSTNEVAANRMNVEESFGFILAGFVLAGSPGPNTLSLAATGAAFGARRGLWYLTGLVTGMVAVMVVTATGVVGVVFALPGAATVISVMAAAYFAYLAYQIATAPPLAEDARQGRHPSFAAGLLLSLVNPKAYAAMAALFSGFVLIGENVLLDSLAKGIALIAILILVNIAWLLAGSMLTQLFRDPGANRAINIAFAVLLVASLAFLLIR
jgi:threonine/homoserine/homoserine lactone efflux protein